MRQQHFPHFAEHADNLDIHCYCSCTIEYAGEHGNALFAKTKWSISQALPIFFGGRILRPPTFQFIFTHFEHKSSDALKLVRNKIIALI